MANTPITIEKDGSLSIDGFQQGIGNSTLSNFADMLGVNIIDNPGVASVNFKFNKITGEIPGCIDDLILESRAWTASEVKKYYTNSLGRF